MSFPISARDGVLHKIVAYPCLYSTPPSYLCTTWTDHHVCCRVYYYHTIISPIFHPWGYTSFSGSSAESAGYSASAVLDGACNLGPWPLYTLHAWASSHKTPRTCIQTSVVGGLPRHPAGMTGTVGREKRGQETATVESETRDASQGGTGTTTGVHHDGGTTERETEVDIRARTRTRQAKADDGPRPSMATTSALRRPRACHACTPTARRKTARMSGGATAAASIWKGM